MSLRNWIRALLGAAMLSAPVPDAIAATEDCAAIDTEARSAEAARDLAALSRLLARARAPGSACPGAWANALAGDLVNLHVDVFFSRVEAAGGTPEAIRANLPVLDEAAEVGETWQLLLTRAEADFELGDYDRAAPLYQRAVAAMRLALDRLDPDTPEAQALPSAEDFARIHGRMTESALLASAYEAPPVTRGAPDDGLFVTGWRGFVVKAVPLPVQYEFGSTSFTEKGEKAARQLAGYLKAKGEIPVTLVGHTDPVGDDGANDRLSLKRAEALRDFLLAEGVAAKINVEGKGEREPFKPVDAARFEGDEQARHALDRRVELVRAE